MVSKSGRKPSRRTCYIAASPGTDLNVLRSALDARGFHTLVPQGLSAGVDWATETRKHLQRADIVVGVLTQDQRSPWVLFELGQASALGCRIILIAPPGTELSPFPLHHFLVLRARLDSHDAIGFALDQVLSAPIKPKIGSSPQAPSKHVGLGSKVDDLIRMLDAASVSRDYHSFEKVIADALRLSGVDVLVESTAQDRGVDFAVWSDDLEPYVGNPLLVEVKAHLHDKAAAERALHQVASYLNASSARWALLLYGEGSEAEASAWPGREPNVLALSIRSLLESLRTRDFPTIVRDLRNRRVHGASS